MRTSRRKPRELRPELMALETVCPVSTLATSIMPPASAAVLASKADDAPVRAARAPKSLPVASLTWPNSPIRRPVVTTTSHQPGATTTLLVAANLAPSVHALSTVAGAIPASSVITVSAALAAPQAQSGGAQPTPTHGGGGIASTPQPTANVASSQAPDPSTTSSNLIRPLTLGPPNVAPAKGGTADFGTGDVPTAAIPGGGSTNGGGTSGGAGSEAEKGVRTPFSQTVTSRITPNDMSGGGGGVPPIEINNGSGATVTNTVNGVNQYTTYMSDVIGDRMSIIVPEDVSFPISNYSWSVSPGDAITSKTIYARAGIQNTALFDTSGPNASVISFAWDQFAGTKTITLDVNYAVGGSGEAIVEVDVVAPIGSISASSSSNPAVVNNGGYYLVGGGSSGNAIDWRATADATNGPNISGGSSIGLIQTMNPFINQSAYHSSLTGTDYTYAMGVSLAGGSPSYPRPLVDDGLGTFYGSSGGYGGVAIGTLDSSGNTTQSVFGGDNPDDPLQSNYASYSMIITYKDTLMFRPSGGIWVPLGNITWTLSMGADNTGSTISPKWALSYSPTSVGTYTTSTDYPMWNDSIQYLTSTYGWVQTSP